MRKLTIATRQSPLALWQANYVASLLRQQNPTYTIELLPLITSGDKAGPQKWLTESGKGMFVKELEEALLTKRADLAVHSMKDLPADFPSGLCLATICKRTTPFDALISSHFTSLSELPKGAKVGTASLRRQSQLLHYRPDLNLQPIRGNVQTRLQKMQEEHFDAIILAAAGLERLAMSSLIQETLQPPVMLPACGQGAIGIECRADDQSLLEILQPLNCPITSLCVNTERLVNAKLGGNCQVPIALYCTAPTPKQLHLRTRVLSANGEYCIEAEEYGDWSAAHQIAERCTQALLAQGAKKLLNSPK
jgi:hydroxymethylbilane synthase